MSKGTKGAKARSGLGKVWDQWWGRANNYRQRENKAFADHVENMAKLGKEVRVNTDHGFHRPPGWRVQFEEKQKVDREVEKARRAKRERKQKLAQLRRARVERERSEA
jgi:hypothetical protein